MNPRLLLPLSLILLTGCACAVGGSAPTVSPTPSPFACETPGSFALRDLPRMPGLSAYEYGLYLPPCYTDDPARSYPVLYLIPGHTSLPQHWNEAGASEMADELILSRQVPPFIVIFTRNIDDDPQAAAITDELIPYVEAAYRIRPERRAHAIAGASLGSIAAYRVGFRHPDRFATVGLFGGGSYPGEEAETRAWLAAIPPENRPFVFLYAGTGDQYMLHRSQIMIAMLDEAGVPHAHVFARGDHSYRAWVAHLPSFIQWAARGW